MADIAVTLKADTTQFEARMHQVETSLGSVNQAARKTSDGFEFLLKSEHAVERQIHSFAKSLATTTDPMNAVASAAFHLGKSLEIGIVGAGALFLGYEFLEKTIRAKERIDKIGEAMDELNAHDLDPENMGFAELEEQAKRAGEAVKNIQNEFTLGKGTGVSQGFDLIGANLSVLTKTAGELASLNFKSAFDHEFVSATDLGKGGSDDLNKSKSIQDATSAELVKRENDVLSLKAQGLDYEAQKLEINQKYNKLIEKAAGSLSKSNIEKQRGLELDQAANKEDSKQAKEKARIEEESLKFFTEGAKKETEENAKKSKATEEILKKEFKNQEDFVKFGIAQSKEADKILKAQAESRFLDLSKKDREGAKGKRLVIEEVERQFQSAPEGSLQKQEAGNNLRKSRNELEDLIGAGSSSRLGGVSSLQKIGGGGGIGSGSIDQQQLDQLKAIKDGIDKLIEQPDRTPVFN